MEEYGIKELLLENKILGEQGQIIDETKFVDFLFTLFMYYISYERYKWFFDKTLKEQNPALIKGKSNMGYAPPICPFKFIGLGDKILFVGSMNNPPWLFKEVFQENFFRSYDLIDGTKYLFEHLFKDGELWKSHECSKQYQDRYCEVCKQDFGKFISLDENIPVLCKNFGIDSYLIINIPPRFLKRLIFQDDFVELSQGNPSQRNEMSGNPEKVFNESLALFLSIKTNSKPESNLTIDSIFNHEIDVCLIKNNERKIIEGTTKIWLDNEYVKKKALTLSLICHQLEQESKKKNIAVPKCSMLIWCISNPKNIEELNSISNRLFDNGKIKIIESKFTLENTGKLEFKQEELGNIKKAFLNILNELLSN